ncbi:type 1 fimbrial protein [Salmonella enterica]|nr:type 1 fimbrial protein [Salmonella enterica subsp. enterica serovar Poona]EAP4203471.1 type 1 fimbrial protein [Salmonella enterica subsp. enterica serovar Poona]EAR0439923.1 type 1 fimbrial protein [Salmonella enterica subsp. enterica serovar Poona]
MKIKNCLFLLGAAMAVMSSSAFAGKTGTQTFTANVVANTCTVSGLNQTIDLGTMATSMLSALPYWGGVRNDSVDVVISGCASSVTQADVTMNSTNTSTSGGVSVQAFAAKNPGGSAQPNTGAWGSGQKKTFPMANGGVTIPVDFWTSRYRSNAITPGTVAYSFNFAIDFA